MMVNAALEAAKTKLVKDIKAVRGASTDLGGLAEEGAD